MLQKKRKKYFIIYVHIVYKAYLGHLFEINDEACFRKYTYHTFANYFRK